MVKLVQNLEPQSKLSQNKGYLLLKLTLLFVLAMNAPLLADDEPNDADSEDSSSSAEMTSMQQSILKGMKAGKSELDKKATETAEVLDDPESATGDQLNDAKSAADKRVEDLSKFKEEVEGKVKNSQQRVESDEHRLEGLQEKFEALGEDPDPREKAQLERAIEKWEEKIEGEEQLQQQLNDLIATTEKSTEKAQAIRDALVGVPDAVESGANTFGEATEGELASSSFNASSSGSGIESSLSDTQTEVNSSPSLAATESDIQGLGESQSLDSFIEQPSQTNESVQAPSGSVNNFQNANSAQSNDNAFSDLSALAQSNGSSQGSSNASSDVAQFGSQDNIVDVELSSEGIGVLDTNFFKDTSPQIPKVDLSKDLEALNTPLVPSVAPSSPLDFGESKQTLNTTNSNALRNLSSKNTNLKAKAVASKPKSLASVKATKKTGSSFFLGKGTAVTSSKLGDVTGGNDKSKSTSEATRSVITGSNSRSLASNPATKSLSESTLETSNERVSSSQNTNRSASRSFVRKQVTAKVSTASNLDSFLSNHKGLIDKIDSGIAGINKAMGGETKSLRASANLSTTSISANLRTPTKRGLASITKENKITEKPKRKLNLVSKKDSVNFRLAGNGKLIFIGESTDLKPYQWGSGYATAAGFAFLIFGMGYFFDKRRMEEEEIYHSDSYEASAYKIAGDVNRRVVFDPEEGRWIIINKS